jgi:hypothetical protein
MTSEQKVGRIQYVIHTVVECGLTMMLLTLLVLQQSAY